MQSHIEIPFFLAFFPLHFLGICSVYQIFISPSVHMTGPCQSLFTNFVLKHSLVQYPLSVHPLFSYQFSWLPRFFLPGCFSQTWTFCCFSVSAIVSSAFMYAGVGLIHELSTFLLSLRDMRQSSITISTALQTFAQAVFLIVTKAINLVDFTMGKCHFLS